MLVRRTWLVIPITVVVCATFAARAVAALVDAQVPESAPLPRVVSPREKTPAPVRATPDGSAFVERNMFCSTCVPVGDPPGPTGTFVADGQLIATSVGDEPRATVRVRATEAQGSWGVGDVIPGLGRIEHIGFVTIDLVDSSGRRATLSLLEQAQVVSAATETPAPAAADPFGDRLRKIDDHTFEVDRSLVRELVGGSMTKAGARVAPVTGKDGTLAGLKFIGVRKDGLAGRFGLENGDLLEAVNNTKIESANTLLGLYSQLETLNTVELQGTRRGKPLTVTLRLR